MKDSKIRKIYNKTLDLGRKYAKKYGQTQRTLKERFSEHKTSVRTHTKNSIGEHFNLPGHSVTNMKILALEKVKQQGTQIIEKRESFWINQLEAEFKGLNRKK